MSKKMYIKMLILVNDKNKMLCSDQCGFFNNEDVEDGFCSMFGSPLHEMERKDEDGYVTVYAYKRCSSCIEEATDES